ncbi:MAG: 2-dehydro-3-deoxyphosphogluconate aldolase [Phycisphaeraceae bacterium]|nr:2-dehydro-3-deoxyphosphogluconate aldolase [Phycisphaeraceae bacterium]
MTTPNRASLTSALEASGIVAVVRASAPDSLVDLCQALVEGGVAAVEITMTTPGALGVIESASRRLPSHCVIGVGSVLDPETARAAILSGAKYVVAPTLNLDVIEMAHRYGCPVIPGALTPTEIMTAWQAGADMVKVFPANHFGPRYIKDLLGPMPQLRLTPTGGVDLDTAADWIRAGCACLGVGSALIRKDLIESGDWAAMTDLAAKYVEQVRLARSGD